MNNMENKIIDLDNHMKILNFLIYIQSIGVISETQRIEYSNYIQEYLKEKRETLNILENMLEDMLNETRKWQYDKNRMYYCRKQRK